ncbi:MAG: Rieske (2Fe-2S) protein [Bacteroidetes bacterium]|nr:Rieske (2Fe-2S) protein [Bacteroidota bacterium]
MWVYGIQTDELQEGQIFCKSLLNKRILLTKSDGQIFACGSVCPHQGYSMENGLVFDKEITCTEHSWTFSLENGQLTFPGSGPRIPVYPIRVVEGRVEVDVSE